MEEALLVKRLSPLAVLPRRATPGSAGYDLASSQSVTIPAGGRALVLTDISVKIPSGTYGRIAPRSGFALRSGISDTPCAGAGVIDSDYRGNVGVLLFNHGSADFVVNVGDRIAQLILERIATPDVREESELDDTERSVRGYGSTGLSSSASD